MTQPLIGAMERNPEFATAVEELLLAQLGAEPAQVSHVCALGLRPAHFRDAAHRALYAALCKRTDSPDALSDNSPFVLDLAVAVRVTAARNPQREGGCRHA